MVYNGVFGVLGGRVNPISSLIIFYVITYPQYKRTEKQLDKEIKEAFDKDEHLFFVSRNMAKPARLE